MADNPYIPFPGTILDIIKHTGKEWTFRTSFEGDVKPGQFFEISVPKYGETPISVSGIGPGFVDFTIRKVGKVTDEIFTYEPGKTLLLRGPYGSGFDTDLFTDGETVIVAGGTGVSPVRGVIQALAESAEPKDKHVIVGFKSPSDMLFRDDLKDWDEKLDLILTVDGAPEGYTGKTGFVTEYIPKLTLKDVSTARAVVVGPPPMMRFSVAGLLKLGLKEENIWVSHERKMCCGLGKCGHCRVGDTYICLDGPVFNYSEAKYLVD